MPSAASTYRPITGTSLARRAMIKRGVQIAVGMYPRPVSFAHIEPLAFLRSLKGESLMLAFTPWLAGIVCAIPSIPCIPDSVGRATCANDICAALGFPYGPATAALAGFASAVVLIGLLANQRARRLIEKRTAEIRQQHDVLQRAISGSPIPAFVIDKDHTVILWNQALVNLSRIKAEEAIGTRGHWRAFYPRERPCLADLVLDEAAESILSWYAGKCRKSQLIPEGYEATDFFPELGHNGRWLRFTAAVIRDPSGRLVGALETLEDVSQSKEAEDALKRSEERYRTLFDGVPVGLYRTTPSGEFLEANHALIEMHGYSDREVFLRLNTASLYINADDRHRWMRLIDRAGVVRDFETQMRKIDGTTIWVRNNSRAVRDAEGQTLFFEGSLEDVTGRKRMEEDLRESEERFRSTFEQAAVGVAHVSPEGHWLRVNQRLCEIVGYSQEELLQRTFQDITHPDDLDADLAQVSQMLAGTIQKYSMEKRYLRKGGDVVWVMLTVSLVRTPAGEPKYFIAVIQDVSERKEIEARLAATQSLLLAAIEQTPAGIIIADADSVRIRLANSAALAIRGETPAPLTEIPMDLHPRNWEVFHPDGTRFEPSELPLSQAILEGRTLKNVEAIIRRQNGEDRWILANSAPVQDTAGQILAGIVVFSDITDLKESEREKEKLEGMLRQSQKMEAIGQLAGGVAHDFNNLLQAINGYTDLALSELPPGHPTRDNLQEVMKAAERATGLVRQLLAFSRQQQIQPEVLDLNDLIAGTLKMMGRMLGEDVELCFRPKIGIQKVFADAGQLNQVLMNLCVNSRDAMPQGGKLSVETDMISFDADYCQSHPYAQEGEFVVLTVSDTGVGMTPDVQERIFEPFFTTKEVGRGTGLGLPTVYGIVKQHRGFISVYSEPGSGTTFRVYLPAVEGDDRRNAADREQTDLASGQGETILLAEDDELVCNLARTILTQAGYRVIAAHDGVEAISLFDQHASDIDLVIADVVMPRKSGKAVYDAVKAANPQVPVLFASGYSFSVLEMSNMSEGYELVSKPFRRVDLLSKVRTLLDRRRSSGAEQNEQTGPSEGRPG